MPPTLTILGKIPPPPGGVTAFNKNLLALAKNAGINSEMLKPSFTSLIQVLLRKKTSVLISMNNRLIILCVVWLARIRGHSVASIVHGNVDNGRLFSVPLVKLATVAANQYVVLNNQSLGQLKNFKGVVRLGTNLLESQPRALDIPDIDDVTFVTYAHRCEVDVLGRDIYGLPFLYTYFSESKHGLIILDINNNYPNLEETNNIRIIRQPVDMATYLGPKFVYLRNTSTDGDSLLVHEALSANSRVIASDVVSRPPGVLQMRYNDPESLKDCICRLAHHTNPTPTNDRSDWLEFLALFSTNPDNQMTA